jgi:hypothetical protein
MFLLEQLALGHRADGKHHEEQAARALVFKPQKDLWDVSLSKPHGFFAGLIRA